MFNNIFLKYAYLYPVLYVFLNVVKQFPFYTTVPVLKQSLVHFKLQSVNCPTAPLAHLSEHPVAQPVKLMVPFVFTVAPDMAKKRIIVKKTISQKKTIIVQKRINVS